MVIIYFIEDCNSTFFCARVYIYSIVQYTQSLPTKRPTQKQWWRAISVHENINKAG